MCQILNRDMCKSLPQHFGLPKRFKYVCAYMSVCVCVCMRKMIDDKEEQSKRGSRGFLSSLIKLRKCRETGFIFFEKCLFAFEK